MGSFFSKFFGSKATPAPQKKMQPLVRPACYKDGKRPSFTAAYARAARRYGFETGRNAGFAKRNNVVVRVKGHGNKDTAHEVPAESIQNDLEYVVPVTIGTPRITLNLDFDTGSSDLWVWSSELAHASRYTGHNIYNPSKSSSAKKASGSWNISYGDGSSASGNVYSETVTVGDVVIKGQAVELAEKLSSSFLQDGGNDGLLGLAWPAINTVSPKSVATPVENMISKKLIDPPVFTVKLGRGDTEPGFYSFGYIDPTVTSNPITYTAVDNSQGFWQVQSTSWSLNGETKSRLGNTTILDTGTTLLLVADDVVDAFYGAVEGATYDDEQGGYKFPTGAALPDVAFAVGETLYTVSGKDLAFGEAGSGYTFGGLQSRGDLDFDIFGDVFLKAVYVVFNQGEKTVGLAQRDD